MKKMRVSAAAFAASMAVLALGAGCGSARQAAGAASVTDRKAMGAQAEQEIELPCSGADSDLEYLRTNGTGKSVDRKMARDKAYQDALAQLASKLESVTSATVNNVNVSSEVGSTESGMNEAEATGKAVSVARRIARANTSGYRTSCEKFTQQGSSYNCYVTIEFGNKPLVKQLFESLKKESAVRADYNYDKYLEEHNRQMEEYEKKHGR